MADVYREEGMTNIQANLKKHAVQKKPLRDCTNDELLAILEQQKQIYSNVTLRNSLPDKGKKIEQKIKGKVR
jgi:RNase P/RNase MRP subunit p30